MNLKRSLQVHVKRRKWSWNCIATFQLLGWFWRIYPKKHDVPRDGFGFFFRSESHKDYTLWLHLSVLETAYYCTRSWICLPSMSNMPVLGLKKKNLNAILSTTSTCTFFTLSNLFDVQKLPQDRLFGRDSQPLSFPALQSLPEASEPKNGSMNLSATWHGKQWLCSLNSASAKMLLCSTCDTVWRSAQEHKQNPMCHPMSVNNFLQLQKEST